MRFLLIAIAALVLFACGEHRSPAAPTMSPPFATSPDAPPAVDRRPGDVRGTVIDFQTQQPVSGAVVAFAVTRSGDGAVIAVTQAITDSAGTFSMPPRPSFTRFMVNDRLVGLGYPFGPRYLGDLMIHSGVCIARYGLVMDQETFLPVAGARVAAVGDSAVTDSTGWYRIDWGCPASGSFGGNTSFLTATHPDYQPAQQILGRGVQSVMRADVTMRRLGR